MDLLSDARALSTAHFRSAHELASLPCVLDGLLRDWPAMPSAAADPSSWTVRNLRHRLGKGPLACGADADGESVVLPFASFVGDYMEGCLDRNPMVVFDATCIEPGAAMALQAGLAAAVALLPEPSVAQTWDAVRNWDRAPPLPPPPLCKGDLASDYAPPLIFAEEDFFGRLGHMERPPHKWLIVGPARSGSPVHTDPMATMAWNALLEGEKRWVLFHPDTPSALLTPWLGCCKQLEPPCRPRGEFELAGQEPADGECHGECHGECDDDWEDLFGWFTEDLQGIKRAVAAHFADQLEPSTAGRVAGSEGTEWWCIEFVQRAGQTVFLPSMWHHAVLNLTDCVAVTQNYVSQSNLAATYRACCMGEMEPALCARWRLAMETHEPKLTALHMPLELLPTSEQLLPKVEIRARKEE